MLGSDVKNYYFLRRQEEKYHQRHLMEFLTTSEMILNKTTLLNQLFTSYTTKHTYSLIKHLVRAPCSHPLSHQKQGIKLTREANSPFQRIQPQGFTSQRKAEKKLCLLKKLAHQCQASGWLVTISLILIAYIQNVGLCIQKKFKLN